MDKKYIITALLVLLTTQATVTGKKCCCGSCGIDEEIERIFDRHSPRNTMKNNFDRLFESKEIRFTSDAQKLKINLTLGRGIKNFDGEITEKNLVITIPKINKKIVVSYDKKANFLSVGTQEKQQQEKKDKNSYSTRMACSSMQQGTTVTGALELEKAAFTYQDGVLTIAIPKKVIPAKKSKKITVNMK